MEEEKEYPSHEYILKCINEIEATTKSRKYKRDQKNGVNVFGLLREKYSDFANNYPTLFTMAAEGEVDKDRLNAMLSMLGRIQDKQISEQEASQKISSVLLGDFVANFDQSDKKSEE